MWLSEEVDGSLGRWMALWGGGWLSGEVDGSLGRWMWLSEEADGRWNEARENTAGGEPRMVDKLVCWLVFRMWKLAQIYRLSERREGKLGLSRQRRGK